MNGYDNLEYKEKAVVTYIISGKRVLLIEKLRGLGAGKINVPGGHIELKESAVEAAIRETKEEVSLDISNLELVGFLFFEFADGLTMKGSVFKTSDYHGIMQNSPEAIPFWCDLDKIPYDKMWADDLIWIPEMLKGRYFRGFFSFDGDKMTSRKIEFYDDFREFNP
ncbi:MAG: hypothetical protein B6229_02035 [Spirochaetaceae bacterium 4572_7]|nr:MAG: hypothetical protein B6229_02035 [Spirochaetaceae bacterium 4572_7]